MGPRREAAKKVYHHGLTNTYPYIPRCFKYAPDQSWAPMGMGGGGMLPDCQPRQMSMCCGDGVCDGPETPQNCSKDCP